MVITDITGLKRASESLARKDEELCVALDNMPGALVYTNEALDIVPRNNRFAEAKLTNESRADLVRALQDALGRLKE